MFEITCVSEYSDATRSMSVDCFSQLMKLSSINPINSVLIAVKVVRMEELFERLAVKRLASLRGVASLRLKFHAKTQRRNEGATVPLFFEMIEFGVAYESNFLGIR